LTLVLLTVAVPARANLVIQPTFGSSITSDPNAAAIEATINQAIAVYQNAFSDPITVTIMFNEMSTGLGQSNTTLYKIAYQTFINALIADGKSASDAVALGLLPSSANNPVTGSTNINIKTADIRALGIAGSFPPIGGFDGVIGLNTHITDVGSPGTTGQYSLLATVEHEIDEVLGLGSDLGQAPGFFNDPAVEDLFRYNSTGGRSYTTNPSALAYFSIDGTTLLAQFDNQNDGGDWGDWQSNPRGPGVPAQVQDAFATAGAHPVLGAAELTALDVIGYDPITQTDVVPEPSTVTMLGLGFAAICGYGWRTRKARPRATCSRA
jgi:hypothetical protein